MGKGGGGAGGEVRSEKRGDIIFSKNQTREVIHSP